MNKTVQVLKFMTLPLIVFVVSYITLFQASTLTVVVLTGLVSILSITVLILGTLLKIDNGNSLMKLVDKSNLEG